MEPRQLIKASLILCFFWLPGLLQAEEIKRYESQVTVPIHEKDEVYARNQAFADARRALVQLAAKDLIGDALYQENES